MLLALDAGNTNITAGLFEGRRLVHVFRLQTEPKASGVALARRLAAGASRYRRKVRACVYGSVVPPLDAKVKAAVRAAFGAELAQVTPASRLGMKLRVKTPRQVGADRILNAIAAKELYGGPAVVIDFGTATTFDVVSRAGDYLGGAILPGPNMAAWALHARTAKLPLVKVARPRRAIGRDTRECIEAGIYFGYLGMIEKVLALTVAELHAAGEGRPRVVATGGLSSLFASDLPRCAQAPDLTLEGLRIAHERLTR